MFFSLFSGRFTTCYLYLGVCQAITDKTSSTSPEHHQTRSCRAQHPVSRRSYIGKIRAANIPSNYRLLCVSTPLHKRGLFGTEWK